jgi:glycosyltransferase involved in cell wall biosynthesis
VTILFLVQHLGMGGALRQLALQAEQLDRRGHSVSLVGLYEHDEQWTSLWKPSTGPAHVLLRRPAVLPLLGAVRRLRRRLSEEGVDVLYAYQGNLVRFIAWLATRRSRTTLVWGLRGAGRSYSLRKGLRLALPFHLCRAVSASVPLLIANSDAARERRRATGFRCRRQLTIPNGFDTDAFRPDADGRARVRAEWGLGDEPLVGLVGRMDPVHKDHRTFLGAAAALAARRPDVRFVVVGDGPAESRSAFDRLSRELGLSSRLLHAGFRDDMPAVYNALDVLCSASRWEGLSNVIGEAMPCGVPCVVTDVGDSAVLVADGGIVVPRRDPEQLAAALETMVARPADVEPLEIRGLITSRFSLARCVDTTEAALIDARASV